jgi:hypothetical protein
VVLLPSYAPDLNPAEGVWANMKNGLGNLAARNVDQLAAVVRNRLKRIQYRPAVISGFLAQTGFMPRTRPRIRQSARDHLRDRSHHQPPIIDMRRMSEPPAWRVLTLRNNTIWVGEGFPLGEVPS